MLIKLSKPIEVGAGDAKKQLDAIDMNLDAMTGNDVEFCVREASAAKGELVRVLVTDVDFHVQLAAKASGVGASDLRRLHARDYVEVVTTVQGFLTGSI
jgi:hypothetical protein